MHGPPQFSSVPAKVCIQAPVPVPDSDISLLSFLRKQESINPTLPELKSPKCDSQPCIAHHSSVPYRRKSVSRLLCLYLTRIFPYCRSCESRNLSIQPCLSYHPRNAIHSHVSPTASQPIPAKAGIQSPLPVPDSDISLLSFLRKQESINPTLPEL
jgi:hypothetical protein